MVADPVGSRFYHGNICKQRRQLIRIAPRRQPLKLLLMRLSAIRQTIAHAPLAICAILDCGAVVIIGLRITRLGS